MAAFFRVWSGITELLPAGTATSTFATYSSHRASRIRFIAHCVRVESMVHLGGRICEPHIALACIDDV